MMWWTVAGLSLSQANNSPVSIDEATKMTVPVLAFSLVEDAPLETARPASINNFSSTQQTASRKGLVFPSSVTPRTMGLDREISV